MAYNLHITRADDWADNDDCWITPQEWLAIVQDDPELTFFDEQRQPYFAVWSGPSTYPQPWFDWSRGNITTKYPDAPMVNKMVRIAQQLDAKVQGDDGELYGEQHPGL